MGPYDMWRYGDAAARCRWRMDLERNRKPQLLAQALYGGASVSLQRKQKLADQLIAVDFAALRAEANERRSVSMRQAWATGRPRPQ